MGPGWRGFLFFFFKQKTAYEISACLVGSEMCIRDSNYHTVSTRGTSRDAASTPSARRAGSSAARPGWELFVAGSNLLQPYTVEYADGSANPRVVRGGLSARFAP